MVTNAKCPFCGHNCRLVEDAQGAEVRCPACLNLFPSPAAATPSLLGRSAPANPTAAAPATPPNRTVLAEPEAMIRYTCPRCKKSLESPVSFAGQKLNCPDCNQRLQIPQRSSPPAGAPVNKTILATEENAAPPTYPAPSSRGQPASVPGAPARPPEVEVVEEAPSRSDSKKSARREHCLECGVDVTRRERVQTCPDCGSVFCSAACYREHNRHAHAPQPKRRRRRERPEYEECPHCGSTERPYTYTEISQAGWILFVVLLILFFPLCWIGLLMTETKVKCRDCGRHLY